MLGAGIDVITTVNIQHLESIADEVEQMTGARVRERVPDWVVRKADQIELVDSSPEQLRRRMLHGNIYPKEKVPQALAHFFRTDNLIALRELALRFLPTKRMRSFSSTSAGTKPASYGKRPSASWRPSRPSRGPMSCCGARPGWRPGSRGSSSLSMSSPTTAAAPSTAGRSTGCGS